MPGRKVKTRKCRVCGERKSLDEFRDARAKRREKLTVTCSTCRAKLNKYATKAYYLEHGKNLPGLVLPLEAVKDPLRQLRHKKLYELRAHAGMSGADVARAAGVPQGIYSQIEALTLSPALKTGKWSSYAKHIARFWGMSPNELFHDRGPVTSRLGTSDTEVAVALLGAFTSRTAQGIEGHVDVLAKKKVSLIFHRLTIREQEAITLYFGLDGVGGRTLDEVAKLMGGVTRQAVDIHIRKGIRKLRVPRFTTDLRDALGAVANVCEVARFVGTLRHLADKIEAEVLNNESRKEAAS